MNKLVRAFIEGAKWWEFESTGATMWHSDQKKVLEEAKKRVKQGALGTLETNDENINIDNIDDSFRGL